MNYRRHGDRLVLFIDERSAESFTRFAIALFAQRRSHSQMVDAG
ncbi:MAG: hypothetical protein U7123_17245 [Potamolinea sp.]